MFVICYLDDIVVYLLTIEAHTEHVRLVLQKLQEYNLYVKISKCIFDAEEIDFLGFKVGQYGISMNPSKVDTIATWPVPESLREIQVFLEFANFYQSFIRSFSKISNSLTEMLQGRLKRKFKGVKFDMTQAAHRLFDKLKKHFASAPMLIYYDPLRQIMLECNASGFGIRAILSQLVSETGMWHPVAFWSPKMILVEQNYGADKAEMLALVCACKH